MLSAAVISSDTLASAMSAGSPQDQPVSPSSTSLPPFRVRQLQLNEQSTHKPTPSNDPVKRGSTQDVQSSNPAASRPSSDAIIHNLRRRSYDDILTRMPRAALNYTDDDGENITVSIPPTRSYPLD